MRTNREHERNLINNVPLDIQNQWFKDANKFINKHRKAAVVENIPPKLPKYTKKQLEDMLFNAIFCLELAMHTDCGRVETESLDSYAGNDLAEWFEYETYKRSKK